MTIIEIILIAFALSFDAFVVSICKGLSIKKVCIKHMIIVGLYFGIFQAIMPLIGYFIGNSFTYFVKYDYIISFLILSIIGISMFFGDDKVTDDRLDIKQMLILSIATSIDALSIGITFSLFKVNIIKSIIIIGIITFILSAIGVKVGNKFGSRYEKLSSYLGGTILILIGLKMLIFH